MTLPTMAIVGVGGLGCPAALALATSGTPCVLRLVDEDRVERGNLHRQGLYTEADLGELKVVAALRALRARGYDQVVELHAEHLAPESAMRLLSGADVVIEGTDNLATKFLASDVSHALRIPVVHGACVAWQGTVLPVLPGTSACYRCIFEALPSDADEICTCATAGVYGPVTSVIGAIMAADALRIARGDHTTVGALARYDGWRQTFRSSVFRRRASCSTCGDRIDRSSPPLDVPGDTLMANTVRIPTPLRTLTQGHEEVTASGATVGDLIADLESRHPGIRERLLDDKGVRRFINLYLNDEDVRFLEGLRTPVKDTDTLTIVPAIAGG